MDVVSTCPLRVASLLWQPRPDAFVLTVVCKGTYTLLPAESTLAREQDPPNELDDYWNDDERRSLHGPNDLAPFKPRADVFLVGHAYAPRGQPVSSLSARMIIGDVDKSIEVHADRVWTQDGQLREGARFTKMPLRYERAGGGPMTSNPVGMRPDAQPDRYGQVPVPNLQPPGHHVERPEDAVPPIGLGPIAPGWPGRWAKLYGNAAGWDYRTGLQRPMPQGIDPGFFNAAPPDQQTEELHSNERIVLENLHPEHARLVTSLPGIAPQALVHRAGAAPQALPLRCDTLGIDTDRGVCSLVWRGQLVLARANEVGMVVIATAGEGQDTTAETLIGGMRAKAVLPFAGGEARREADVVRTMLGTLAEPSKPALPFREVSPWEEAPVIARASEDAGRREKNDGTGTILAMLGGSGEVLPFVRETALLEMTPPLEVVPILVSADATPWAPALAHENAPPQSAVAPPPAPTPAESPMQRSPASVPAPLAVPASEPPTEPACATPAVLSLEQCARMDALLAHRPEQRTRILSVENLTEEMWAEQHMHHERTVREELARGKRRLLAAYDAAYVAALEEQRGPITADAYARLVIAVEREQTAAMLVEMDLPEAAMMHVRRVWLGRTVKDPRVAAEVRASMRAAAKD